MKRLVLFTGILVAITTSGCDKYLEVDPDNRTQLNSKEKISQLLASAYPGANYMAFAEASSDIVGDRGSGRDINVSRDPFLFQDVRSNDPDSPEFYWNACYEAIAAANIALQAIEQISNQSEYQAFKGEALVARAYSHFMLVSFFSKFYDGASAASDPGIPYVTEVENVVIKQYSRNTVAYVYEMVEKDLLAGLPLLKDETYSVPAYHFTRKAANAFAARFYLFKKDYAKVITYTNQTLPISDIPASLRPWNSVYANPNGGLTRLEIFSVFTRATTPANLLLCETYSPYIREYASGRFGYDFTNYSRIGVRIPVLSRSADVRWAFSFQTYGGDNTAYIPKLDEYFKRVSVNADIGDTYLMIPLFTMEEVLFNKVEALIYQGNTNDAISLLNQYLSTRIYNYSAANPNHILTAAKIITAYNAPIASSSLSALLDFKRAEFIHEGMRWFDIIRYKIPVVHYLQGSATPYTLTAEDKRKVFQIPESTSLSGLAPNPR